VLPRFLAMATTCRLQSNQLLEMITLFVGSQPTTLRLQNGRGFNLINVGGN
jgi:hypothetical protein